MCRTKLMSRWTLLVVLLYDVVVKAQYDYPTLADGTVSLDCGTVGAPVMKVKYEGPMIHSLYAREDPTGCTGSEIEPTVILISDVLTNGCPYKQQGTLSVYYIEVGVQRQEFRQKDDPVYVATCNYEMGGTKATVARQTQDGLVYKEPILKNMGSFSTSFVSLSIYDSKGAPITSATIGSYIQLRAYMAKGVPAEASFKMWNCKALSPSYTYYILVAGCGDGDVIKAGKGFFTSGLTSTVNKRLARSFYFKAFALPGSTDIQFECSFIVCGTAAGCDGPSCQTAARRKKRDVTSGMQDHHLTTVDAGMRMVRANLMVVPPEEGRPTNVSSDYDHPPSFSRLPLPINHEGARTMPGASQGEPGASTSPLSSPRDMALIGLLLLVLGGLAITAVLTVSRYKEFRKRAPQPAYAALMEKNQMLF